MVEYARQNYEAGFDFDNMAGKSLDKLMRDILSQQSRNSKRSMKQRNDNLLSKNWSQRRKFSNFQSAKRM